MNRSLSHALRPKPERQGERCMTCRVPALRLAGCESDGDQVETAEDDGDRVPNGWPESYGSLLLAFLMILPQGNLALNAPARYRVIRSSLMAGFIGGRAGTLKKLTGPACSSGPVCSLSSFDEVFQCAAEESNLQPIE